MQNFILKILNRKISFYKKLGKSHRYIGFTLAEVLITLGIIGIVASMTIPTLINSYQKIQYATQLKKSYVTFQQGLKEYIASKGVTNLGDTDLFDGTTQFNNAGRQAVIDNTIKTIFNVVKSCKCGDNSCKIDNYTFLDTEGSPSNFLSSNYNFCIIDGACFSLSLYNSCQPDNTKTGAMKAECGTLNIDINGSKKPNKVGRDFFNFSIGHDGTLFPYWGRAYADYYGGDYAYWMDPSNVSTNCGTLGSTDTTGLFGDGCAARIMEEAWQMKY